MAGSGFFSKWGDPEPAPENDSHPMRPTQGSRLEHSDSSLSEVLTAALRTESAETV